VRLPFLCFVFLFFFVGFSPNFEKMNSFGARRRHEESQKKDDDKEALRQKEEQARLDEEAEIGEHVQRLVDLIMDRLATRTRAAIRLSDIMGDQHHDILSSSYFIEIGFRMGQHAGGDVLQSIAIKVLGSSFQWKAWERVQGWLRDQEIDCAQRQNEFIWDLEIK
jgi:hypothetical protein